MDTQRRWIAYDTFKLIVALILFVLILILLLQRPAVPSAAGAVQATEMGGLSPAAQTPRSPTHTSLLSTTTLPLQASLTPTLLLPTDTLAPSPTTVLPTATPASADQPTPTPTAALATATPAAATLAAASATTQPQSGSVDCPLAQPSRLAVGDTAQILANLNLRRDAGIDKQIVGVGLPNSQVEIMGGPICTPYQNGAYVWWNVRTTDGQTGWSAEASLSNGFYLLQPVP